MAWQTTIYTPPLAAAAMVSGGLLVVAYRSREKRGALPLSGMLVSVIVWSIADGVALARTEQWVKVLMNNVRFFGPTAVTVSLFLFAASYTNRDEWLSRRRVAALCGIHAVTLVLVWTNQWHHLVRERIALDSTAGFVLLEINWGVWFYVHAAYSYLLLGGAVLMLLDELRESGDVRTYRGQTLTVLAAAIVPWALNAAFLAGTTEVDITPLGFTISGGMLAIAVFRYEILELVPIAREQAMEEMADLVVTVDKQWRVVDCNSAARAFVGVGPDYAGMPAEEFFSSFPDQIERFRGVESADAEVTVTRDAEEYHFDVSISPVHDASEDRIGRVFVFRDITDQKSQERRLREREQRLDLLRQVLTRVLRHNIRNNLQVVKMNTQLIADVIQEEHRERAEMTLSIVDDLVETSEKARGVDRVIGQEQTRRTIDISASLQKIVDSQRSQFPDTSFTLDAPETCPVEVIPSIEVAMGNLIENAAEHNDAPTPEVDATVERDADAVSVTISDNGPGIPDHELSVLRQEAETPLRHGSGVGLWLIDWVIENSTASITYDADDEGTDVVIQIPRTAEF